LGFRSWLRPVASGMQVFISKSHLVYYTTIIFTAQTLVQRVALGMQVHKLTMQRVAQDSALIYLLHNNYLHYTNSQKRKAQAYWIWFNVQFIQVPQLCEHIYNIKSLYRGILIICCRWNTRAVTRSKRKGKKSQKKTGKPVEFVGRNAQQRPGCKALCTRVLGIGSGVGFWFIVVIERVCAYA